MPRLKLEQYFNLFLSWSIGGFVGYVVSIVNPREILLVELANTTPASVLLFMCLKKYIAFEIFEFLKLFYTFVLKYLGGCLFCPPITFGNNILSICIIGCFYHILSLEFCIWSRKIYSPRFDRTVANSFGFVL